MKGLFLKDFYLFIKHCRGVMIFMALSVTLAALVPQNAMFTLICCLLTSMVPMTLIAYDEKDRWNSYAAALPYSAKDIVLEKYLFGLILSGITVLLTVVSGVIAGMVGGQLDLGIYLGLSVTLVSVCLIAPALMLPFIFKYGVEKGRLFYYIMIGGVSAIIAGLSYGDNAFSVFGQSWERFGYLAVVLAMIIYAVSVIISVKLYSAKKE